MIINWTACSKRRPPENRAIILKDIDGCLLMKAHISNTICMDSLLSKFELQWTEYSDDLWDFLTDKNPRKRIIKWNTCEEIMPPNNDTKIITRSGSYSFDPKIETGAAIHKLIDFLHTSWRRKTYWLPYSEELWNEVKDSKY